MTEEGFRRGDFGSHIGSLFRVEGAEGAEVVLELHSLEELPASGSGGRAEPFSLVFTGPAEHFLPQGTYRMQHHALGDLEIFIVPIGPDPQTGLMRYEAIFN